MRNSELPGQSRDHATDSMEVSPAGRPSRSLPGGSRELLALALPLILSNAFMTVQITVDRVLLSWYGPLEVGAAFPAVMMFWLPYGLLQGVAGYVTTFVAQYTGALRPHRVGPAVWQGLHFSLITGTLFLGLWLIAPEYIALGDHDPQMQALEVTYFRCLCFCALPMLIVVTISGFFSGRGAAWTVLGINAIGTVVNVIGDYLLIFGWLGCPRLGIAGAGVATFAASLVSATVALVLFFQHRYRREYATWSGWRPECELFSRLLRYGGPAGLQFMLEVLAFTLFTMFVGRLGPAAAAATSIAVTLNMFTFMPMYGMGQAVAILVGQRLGEGRPDLAERSTQVGFHWAIGYMVVIALIFICFPGPLVMLFETDGEAIGELTAAGELISWQDVATVIPTLLLFIAIYSLADAANLVYANALRGAGDTRFVTLISFSLAWPVMVIPTLLVVRYGGNLYMAWAFASLYIVLVAGCCWLRFRAGQWKSMRVIEPAIEELPTGPQAIIGSSAARPADYPRTERPPKHAIRPDPLRT